jgi:hypothetical protein
MSDSAVDGQGVPWGTVLWGAAAILLVLFVVGVSGLIHLAVWVLVLSILAAIGFVCVFFVMRLLGGP